MSSVHGETVFRFQHSIFNFVTHLVSGIEALGTMVVLPGLSGLLCWI